MTNPVEDYLQTKEAQGPGFLSRMGRGFKSFMSPENIGVVAGSAMMAGALDFPGDVARKAYYAITKKRDFNRMMEQNPDLQQLRQENGDQFNAHYTSLRSVNPEFASDPTVAGTYMRQMSMSPATAGKVIVESLGGLPRPTQGTKATQLLGMQGDPLQAYREQQLGLGIQKLRGEVEGMPGRTAREQEMHEAKMLELADKATHAPLQERRLRQQVGMHGLQQKKLWGDIKAQAKRNR